MGGRAGLQTVRFTTNSQGPPGVHLPQTPFQLLALQCHLLLHLTDMLSLYLP